MKKGIDISYCQKGLDFAAVKAEGVEFVLIRAGISTRTDTEFYNHMEGAIKTGLPYGFYWYSRAFSIDDAKKEAEACLQAINPYAPTYPVFCDIEDQDQIDKLDNATRTSIVTTFCEIIKAAGYTAGVYINHSWLEYYVDKTQIVDKYDIWLAHWTYDPNKPSKYDYGQKIWQWGLNAIGGIKVDGDICYFDYDKPAAPPVADSTTKTVSELADEVIFGLWGNGQVRIDRLTAAGYDAAAVQDAVNIKLYGKTAKKTIIEIVKEVVAGDWGNGQVRIDRLTAEGYSPDEISEIQMRVNEVMAGIGK